ncbi:DUF1830 domain-containing protein [Myxosarcina sp. GI1]|uniref:DUF1830 domain-containing protein n=1 Tax=Myxosarcina sp. GI1 TaxID=1541065 RepID=UPI00068D9C5B|nr:DUF1830 domain-containing protein [Myxosarcina sp. GI1]
MTKSQGVVYQPPLDTESEEILCQYVNATSHLQVIKINNIDNYDWEKVVFPGQRILFNTFKRAELSIYSTAQINTILIDTIDCKKLKVDE